LNWQQTNWLSTNKAALDVIYVRIYAKAAPSKSKRTFIKAIRTLCPCTIAFAQIAEAASIRGKKNKLAIFAAAGRSQISSCSFFQVPKKKSVWFPSAAEIC